MKYSLTQKLFAAGVITAAAATVRITATGAGGSTITYTAGTPVVTTITDGTTEAPWNTFQGDSGYSPYGFPGALLPTYRPGGAATPTEPNLAVYPGAGSGTDGSRPTRVVRSAPRSPRRLLRSGNNATEAVGAPAGQPAGITLPLPRHISPTSCATATVR